MARAFEQLVGRAAELGTFDAALADLEDGHAGFLVLAGEPGIGKTRLLAELGARGDARGHIVLSGSASELEVDLPFWLFVDALDEYVAGLAPERLSSLDAEVLAELARVLPSLASFAGEGQPVLGDARYRTHRAVRELLERLAATQPLVLSLDDVHWADSASTELIGTLLRRPPGASVLIAMAARPRQLPERLAGAFARADRAGSLSRLELAGLERGEVGLLLGESVDDAFADSIYEQSGGNPFYLEQLARAPRAAGRTGDGAADLSLASVEVSPAVVTALGEELGLLSAATRVLLDGAAVAGDPFELELAAAAADVDETSAAGALDQLLTLELVRTTEVPRRFRFRHPLVRRAVYESAPGGWLLGAHERCADALAARGASATARAHHVEHAARHGDAAALAVLRAAGEAAELRAPASAARWFGAALRLLPDDALPEPRVELLMARAKALASTGSFAASRADLLESIDLVADESVATWAQLTVVCSGIEHLLGRHAEAHDRVLEALKRLEDPAAPESVSLRIQLAFDGIFGGDYGSMREAAEEALEAARPLGDRPLIAAASAALLLADAFAGATAAAEARRPEVVALVEAMSDEELARRIDGAANLAVAELFLDRYPEAETHAARTLAVGRMTGQLHLTVFTTLGTARYMQGRLAEAGQVLDPAIEAARVSGNDQSLAWHLVNRALAAHAEGDLDTSIAAAEEAFELMREIDEKYISAWAAVALAATLVPSRDPERAVSTLVASVGGEELPLIPGGWRAFALELLALGNLGSGDRVGAVRAASLAEAIAGSVGLPMAQAWAQRAAAAVALDNGDTAAAAKRALASAAAADRAGCVVEGALSRRLAGRALAQSGNTANAVTELERAAAELQAVGALRQRDATERELRKLGRRVHRQTRSGKGDGVGSLTERELQVARLVVDRKTNAEIADELFLSVKTVESHVRNLFHKLGVSSRVEVARTVERADRAGHVS
jgi:DNA-binding CsgD family transcriptional regulator